MHTSMLLRFQTATLTTLLIGCVVACSGGGGGSSTLTDIVGPGGATLTSADGHASLVVPAAAVTSNITVALAPATDGFLPDPQIVPGTVYRVTAPDTALAQLATLSIDIPEGQPGGPAGQEAAIPALRDTRTAAVRGGPQNLTGLLWCTPDIGSGTQMLPGMVCGFDSQENNGQCPDAALELVGTTTYMKLSYSLSTTKYPAILCLLPVRPLLTLASLSSAAAAVPLLTNFSTTKGQKAQTKLPQLAGQTYAVIYDKTPPTIQLTSVFTGGDSTVSVLLSANATDNVGVKSVAFYKQDQIAGTEVLLATLTAPPYQWQSASLPAAEVYGTQECDSVFCKSSAVYYVVASDAAGNTNAAVTGATFNAPYIDSFTATPSAVSPSGTSVVLSWGVYDAETITIDQGVGVVTTLASKTVTVNSATTFTLTATNTGGTATATVSVTLAARPPPTISSFTTTPASLPAGGGSVTLAWSTSDADTLSIDKGVGTVTGSSTSVNVTANSTFTLTATNTTGNTTAQASVVVAVSNDRFVDVTSGSDTNPCSQAAPCKTIAKALSGAPSGATVYLNDGVYSSANQSGGVATIPDGVTLTATHAGAASLTATALIAAGSATVSGIVLDKEASAHATLSASSATGTPTLSLTGVLIKWTGDISIGGNVKATMTPGALAGGLYTAALPSDFSGILTLSGTAELLIQGGIIDGNNLGAPAFGGYFLFATDSSKLTLDGATVRNRAGPGLVTGGSAAIVLKNGTVIDNVGLAGDCATAAAIVMNQTSTVTLDHAQLSNLPGSGICVRNSLEIATIQITQSTISAAIAGVDSEQPGTVSAAVVTISGSSFTGGAYGIRWNGPPTTNFGITGTSFTGNGTGIYFNGGSLKVRSSTCSGNSDTGIWLDGSTSADLGTTADPGANTFSANTNFGLRDNLAVTLQAVGNTWIASQQGADAAGHYSTGPAYMPVPKLGPLTGKNFSISGAVTLDL